MASWINDARGLGDRWDGGWFERWTARRHARYMQMVCALTVELLDGAEIVELGIGSDGGALWGINGNRRLDLAGDPTADYPTRTFIAGTDAGYIAEHLTRRTVGFGTTLATWTGEPARDPDDLDDDFILHQAESYLHKIGRL